MDISFSNRDEFQRKQIAEKAITLLRSNIDISPMVIDGSWGTGKTEFCKKLINLMSENDTHHLIYIDAFQADHADEPLLTVLAEVVKVIPEGEKNSFIKKVIPAARYGIKTLAKAGIAHLLKQDAAGVVDDFETEIQQATNTAIDAAVETVLKDHIEAEKNLKALQDALKEVATIKPIVLFVDELDRCRPDFSVSMLEVLKHTFDVDGVQFVLVTNTEQLKASINHCYGESVDSQRYLDKFLKYSISLPSNYGFHVNNLESTSVAHFKNLVKSSELLKESRLNLERPISFFSHVVKQQDLSLREIETIVNHLEIYQLLTDGKGLAKNLIFGFLILRFFTVIIYCTRPDISSACMSNCLDGLDLADYFGEPPLAKIDGEYSHPEVHQILLVALGRKCATGFDPFTSENAEENVMWNREVDSLFSSRWMDSELISSVQSVVRVLQLTSSRV